jgi:hypothetical protein
MLFYGNYMRGARLKWRHLDFLYILSCFDPLICTFNFFVDSFTWPMMQYKVSPIDNVWSFTEGPPIQLWKTIVDGFPKLPQSYSKLPNLGP